MKKLLFIGALCALAACSGEKGRGPVSVELDVCNPDSINGNIQTIRLTGDLRGVSRLAFNQFPRGQKMTGTADTLIEIVPGYYALCSPRFAEANGNDTIEFRIESSSRLEIVSDLPDAFHLVLNDGTTLPVEAEFTDLTNNPTIRYHEMTGEANFARNEELATGKAGVYDAIPSFKSVTLTGGESTVNPDEIEFADVPQGDNSEAYKVTVAGGKIKVEAPRSQWARIGLRLRNTFGTAPVTLPDAVITDEPSMPYRGLMVDVARNFTTPEDMRTVLDLMATYGLNKLHFHPTDDEAWRIEIAGLPELTEVGARRGYTPGSDGLFLEQIYSGDGNPATVGSSNGSYSRADFVDMLRYADSLGIAVIPEIESPGHARAAIKAMAVRAKRTGDNSWLLNEGAEVDNARYTSAQGYHDNVMNPALEGPYKLMDAVADELISIYKEAGVPLTAIHIGGDEVPHGAWSASPAIAELKAKEGLETEKDIHAYFVRRVADRLAAKGIATSGWQEVALDHSDAYNKAVAPEMYSVNCWSTLPSGTEKSVVDRIAEAGYPIILSNVEHFYLDMQYAPNPNERGLRWAGWSDEFSGLSGYPAELCTAGGAKVLGVQGQIFSETIRNFGDVQRMMLPKMLGMAERGWNPSQTYTEPGFNAAVAKEIPKWDAAGITYRLRQPGLKLTEDNKLVANTPYPGTIIRVTLDGTTPDANSPELKPGESIDLSTLDSEPTVARAVLFSGTQASAPVTLRLK